MDALGTPDCGLWACLWYIELHDNRATDGYGAIDRLYPSDSRSVTHLDLGVNLFVCIVA